MGRFSVLVTMAALAACMSTAAAAQDRVTFATNWLAQSEHGGFYQALADGTYAEYGLDVTILQGGPQTQGRALLAAGQVEFYMGVATGAISALEQGIPTVTLASLFQKDPQVLIAHPGRFHSFEELAGASKYILSATGLTSYFAWMKSEWPEFSEEKYQPYQFNPAAFLADGNAIQQGYVTSEPLSIEREAGFVPDVWLLADQGYRPYSTTIEVMRPWLEQNEDVARRFVEASIIGWYNYLYGDNEAANALIRADNPEMTDEQIAHGVEKMKEYGIVVSGDAETHGIGCMTEEGWTSFYEAMVAAGVYPAGLDVSEAYTTEYVCHGLGMELVR